MPSGPFLIIQLDQQFKIQLIKMSRYSDSCYLHLHMGNTKKHVLFSGKITGEESLFLFFLRFKTSRAVRKPCFSLNCVFLKFTSLTCHWHDVSQSVTQKCHITLCDVTGWQKGTWRTSPMGCQASAVHKRKKKKRQQGEVGEHTP